MGVERRKECVVKETRMSERGEGYEVGDVGLAMNVLRRRVRAREID